VKIGEVLLGVVAEVFLHDRRIDGKASGGANADRVTVRLSLWAWPAVLLQALPERPDDRPAAELRDDFTASQDPLVSV
jgi:hypothetical protein